MPREPTVTPTQTREAQAATASQALTLSVAAAGTLLVLAIFSAVVVTVGDVARSLHAGVESQTWTLSGMSLGLAGALLTAGDLADEVGHRRVLTCSAGLLAAASILGALAPSMTGLVAARVLQGVSGGGVLAGSLGALGQSFPAGAERTRATGIWGAAVGGGIAIGPLAGAALTGAAGWRSAYWLEAAAAAAVMVAAARLADPRTPVGRRSHPRGRRLDLRGIATLAGGMVLLTAALVEGRRDWTGRTTLVLAGAAALALCAFAVIELSRPRPMLDPRLFAQPQFLASVTGALFSGLAVVGLMSYSPSLMQRALHLSALGSAAVLTAWSATSMAVALGTRQLPSGLHVLTRLVIGLALTAAGEAALAGLDAGESWERLLPGLIIAGVGSGTANAALGRIAIDSVPPHRAGMGSGANNTARYLGGAAGVALVVSIASRAGQSRLTGWNTAALVCAGLCALGAVVVAGCRARQSRVAVLEGIRPASRLERDRPGFR